MMWKARIRQGLLLAAGMMTMTASLAPLSVSAADPAGAQTLVPSILITEVVANSANKENGNGKVVDGYEYIEIYNNTPEPFPLKGNRIHYYASSTHAKWQFVEDVFIPPHEAMVVWVKSPALETSLEEFNSQYEAHIRPEQFTRTESAGLTNSGDRRLLLVNADGLEISRVDYVGINDAVEDHKSITYAYPTDGTPRMRKIGNRETPTPGRVLDGQVPEEAAPYAPRQVTATAGDREISLSWQAAPGEKAPVNYRYYVNGVLMDEVVSGTSHTVKGLTNGKAYTLSVAAVSAGGQLSVPVPVKATPAPAVPDQEAPGIVQGVQAEAGLGEATVRWKPGNESDLAAYRIYSNGKLAGTVNSDTGQAVVKSLTGGMSYAIQVSAVDSSNNESPKSGAVEVIPRHEILTQEEMNFELETPFPPFDKYFSFTKIGPVVPGLKQGLIPQGIDYLDEKDWFIQSYYRRDKRPSVVTALDAETGKLEKAFHLYHSDGTPYTGHAGGIAASRDHVWIANNQFMYQLKKEDIMQNPSQTDLRFTDQGFRVLNNASFAAYSDGVLWSGDYYQPPGYDTNPVQKLTARDGTVYQAWLAGYKLDPETDQLPEGKQPGPAAPALPDYVIGIQHKIQGAAFTEDGHVVLSFTTENAYSTLLKYKLSLQEEPHSYTEVNGQRIPVWFLDKLNLVDSLMIPSYAEEVVVRDGMLSTVFESGSHPFSPYVYYPLDRIHSVDLKAWAEYDKLKLEGLEPVMNKQDKAQIRVLHMLGRQGPVDVTASSTFSSSRPDVVTVTSTGGVRAAGYGETVLTVEYGGRTAQYHIRVEPDILNIKLTSGKGGGPIASGDKLNLTVTARLRDGSSIDVTALVKFHSSRPETGSVTSAGEFVAGNPGTTILTAAYRNQTSRLPVIVQPR